MHHRPPILITTLAGLLSLGAALLTLPAAAARDPSSLCSEAAAQAARETGVPESVLRAISLTETGRNRNGEMRSWPWTVNMEGAGKWFDSRDEALSFAWKNFQRGARSFDIGCFQINFKWHGEAFASIDEMFDPLANARYAARFLGQLHDETGDWSLAAGAYHSRTEEYASRYRKQFDKYRAADLDPDETDVPARIITAAARIEPRVNLYPLLQPGTARGMASLVPMSDGARPLFASARP